ncbi:DUF3105 domain-containing protein [Gaiella sp.]|uniref:DUF3105 domain-containing protein n=1 Tax=Gaiella sp. TaxID=2663207 RepID=UPI00326364A1
MPPTPRPHGPKKKKTPVRVPASGGDSNRRLLIMMGIAAVVVVIAGGLSFVLFGNGSSVTGGASAAEATKKLEGAGCTVKAVNSIASNDHSVATPEGTSSKWNTSPPTSGPHYSQQAIWGSFTEPLLQAQVVHNLEHGGIFIQYGEDVPKATVDQLQVFYDAHRNGTLLAPLPSLGSKIALGAWTTKDGKPDEGTAYLVTCADFDEDAYAAFFAANQFKGPERFPKNSMQPGS